ncbi:MAG: phosphodiester glycosidase family protein [Clostridia bacterium]|nr:phosphodiester glycosidase family protein [Clostridia bacterium]
MIQTKDDKTKKRGKLRYLFYTFTSLFLIAITFICLTFYSNIGFFVHLRELYIGTAMTTLNHQYLATWFISREEIDRVMAKSAAMIQTEKTDSSKVIKLPSEELSEQTKPDIEVKEISGSYYVGKLMTIKNASKVKLAVTSKLFKMGEFLEDLITANHAVAGINASGFVDPNGKGFGGTPTGIVIKDGKVVYDPKDKFHNIIGFNKENVLIVGRYKRSEIDGLGLRDAISFAPFLIVNGNPQITQGDGGWGIQPRTAIAQKRTGEVLFLVIDGRQIHSVGATLKQVQDILLENGAYNAANLDGGSSAVMFYNGEILNKPCSPAGQRYLPDAFVVEK